MVRSDRAPEIADIALGGYAEYNYTFSYQIQGFLSSNTALGSVASMPSGTGNAAFYADNTAYSAIYWSAYPNTSAYVLTDAPVPATTAPAQTTPAPTSLMPTLVHPRSGPHTGTHAGSLVARYAILRWIARLI